MEDDREQLRRLAVWLACRRDVDQAVAQLTRYGPAASDQVASHLSALKHLVELEAEAFAAVERGASPAAQKPLVTAEPLRAQVHSLQQARERREQA